MAALFAAMISLAQAPFALDTTFRTEFETWYVSSTLPLEDGKILASGVMRFPGELYDKRLVRLLPNGERDETFYNSGLGQGKITEWEDKFYVSGSFSLRRVQYNGNNDLSFGMSAGTIPYFSPLQGGDYHVFPDGRVVMSGVHNLSDSIRGFMGYHNFIWFTNTGYLDTTRTHRKGNGAIFFFKELPDGKFICTGTGTVYDDQPVARVFRVHADGAVDNTFQSGVDTGLGFTFLSQANGRVIVGGKYTSTQAPNETIRLTRFNADGTIDLSFNSPDFSVGAIPDPSGTGTTIGSLTPFEDGMFFVTGNFQFVNGQPRRGICLLNEDGDLLSPFHDAGVSPFTHMGFTYAEPSGIQPSVDGAHFYIWGAYHGYDDGTINDDLQRFVTRLHRGDINTTIAEEVFTKTTLRVYPNPTDGLVMIEHDLQTKVNKAFIRIRDALGRNLESHQLANEKGQLVIDTRRFEAGMYTIELINEKRVIHLERLIIQ
jgi:hypothetical protein